MTGSRTLALFAVASASALAQAGTVAIGNYSFDLDQFNNAAVTYRSDGDVDFDGKLWDNAAGVDGVTFGELAAGQYGSDPGDQLTLQSRGGDGPDWFTLTYAGGLSIGAANTSFVFYEITSSNSGVDLEGISFEVSVNGGAFVNANLATATFLDYSSQGAENVNELAFALSLFGLGAGDTLNTVTVRNLDTGSGTSDPDFIFGGLSGNLTVIPLPSAAGLALAGTGLVALRRRRGLANG